MAAKAKCIADGNAYGAFLSFVKSQVQLGIKGGIVGEMVDGGGYNSMHDGHDGGNGFDGSGSAEQVACHGLCGADVHPVGIFSKNFLNGFYLLRIADGRGGAMNINVINLAGSEGGIF